MRSWDEVLQITTSLMNSGGVSIEKMREILFRYDGDYVIPMPSHPNEPNMPMLTPALIGEAVDSMAMRAASVRPTVFCPAINPAKERGSNSLEYAQKRRRFISAVYEHSKWQLGRRRAYRHAAAYNTQSIVVVPDLRNGMPQIQVRDPLGTYADPRSAESLEPPEYVAFVNSFSGANLRGRFPSLRSEQGGPITNQETQELWNIVEWMDCDMIMFGLVGPVTKWGRHYVGSEYCAPSQQLSQPIPNKANMCCAITPSNVSLGNIASRLGSMIGSVDLQARLMGLDILAQERSIFPDFYVVGKEGSQPRIVSNGGDWPDGRTGIANILADVQQVGTIHQTPDQRTAQTIDRLERNFRVSTGLVPQTGGETYGALRTGAGINALAGMAIDPRIQEMHETSEAWLPQLNRAILATANGYWPDKKYTIFSGWPGDKGQLEYTPRIHGDKGTLHNTVTYAMAGADISQETQILGSLLGTQAISLDTFRTSHPMIGDPQAEAQQVLRETIQRASVQAIEQQLISGQLPLPVAALIDRYLSKGETVFEAIEHAQRDMQELQASQPPPAPEGMAAAPEAMPGLAAGPSGMQAPAPVAADPQISVPTDVSNMRQLMQTMATR